MVLRISHWVASLGLECHKIIQHATFGNWLFSLNVFLQIFIQDVAFLCGDEPQFVFVFTGWGTSPAPMDSSFNCIPPMAMANPSLYSIYILFGRRPLHVFVHFLTILLFLRQGLTMKARLTSNAILLPQPSEYQPGLQAYITIPRVSIFSFEISSYSFNGCHLPDTLLQMLS